MNNKLPYAILTITKWHITMKYYFWILSREACLVINEISDGMRVLSLCKSDVMHASLTGVLRS